MIGILSTPRLIDRVSGREIVWPVGLNHYIIPNREMLLHSGRLTLEAQHGPWMIFPMHTLSSLSESNKFSEAFTCIALCCIVVCSFQQQAIFSVKKSWVICWASQREPETPTHFQTPQSNDKLSISSGIFSNLTLSTIFNNPFSPSFSLL